MKKGMKKFSAAERKIARTTIRRIRAEHIEYGHEDVARELNTLGIKHPNSLWNAKNIAQFCWNNKIQGAKRVVRHTQAAPLGGDRLELTTLILAANLAPEKKERLLSGLFGGRDG